MALGFRAPADAHAAQEEARAISAALRQSEERYRELVELLPEIVFEVDERGGISFVNQAGFELTGYEPAELERGMDALSLLVPEDRTRAAATIASVLAGGPSGNEYTALRKDGSRFPVLIRSAPIRRDGRVVGLRGLVIDLSKQKQVEDALRASEERLKTLLEHAGDGISVMDAKGNISYRSPANARILGYTDEQILGYSMIDYVHPDDRATALGALRQLAAPGASRQTEFRVRHKDGSWRHMAVNARNLLDDSRVNGILVNYRDITDARGEEAARRRAEADKLRLEQELLHAQKLEAVGRLAGGIAHDFNNLLTAITGNVSLALMDVSQDHPAHESLLEIFQSTERAARLIRQLLAFSRRQPIEPTLVDLNQLVVDLTTIVARLIGEDVAVETRLAQPTGLVQADLGQIEQALVNLVINARDAMPGGGTLVIETGRVDRLPEAVKLAGGEAAEHAYATLTVQDTGCGMDEATRRRAFDPFFTTKPKDRGTGLGLSTVYGIVQQHRGAIDLQSSPGRGCLVRIYLPCAARADTSSQPEPAVFGSAALPRGSETLLVVEDEPAVNRVACALLQSLGYRVHSARDAPEAFTVAERHGMNLDLLLTDVVLPGLNGRELAERLTADFPCLKVLYASGYSEDVILHHGVVDEGLEFIAKPYSLSGLARKVRQLLDEA